MFPEHLGERAVAPVFLLEGLKSQTFFLFTNLNQCLGNGDYLGVDFLRGEVRGTGVSDALRPVWGGRGRMGE